MEKEDNDKLFTELIENVFQTGEFEVSDAASGQDIVTKTFEASGTSLREVPEGEIQKGVFIIEEGEKRKWEEIDVDFGLDYIGKIPFPKLKTRVLRTPKKRIVKYIKYRGRR